MCVVSIAIWAQGCPPAAHPLATSASAQRVAMLAVGRIFGSGRAPAGAPEGKPVSDAELVKKSDDWAIEETNVCLGRVTFVRFKEMDDLARRTQRLWTASSPGSTRGSATAP